MPDSEVLRKAVDAVPFTERCVWSATDPPATYLRAVLSMARSMDSLRRPSTYSGIAAACFDQQVGRGKSRDSSSDSKQQRSRS